MTKQAVTIQPGPLLYEVWGGVMKALGKPIVRWSADRGVPVASLRLIATGATNGPKSAKMRQLMIDEVGLELLEKVYLERLRLEGLLK